MSTLTQRTVEHAPLFTGGAVDPNKWVVILVNLHEDKQLPSYVRVRQTLSARLVTGEVQYKDLGRLQAYSGVESVELSRSLPLIA